MYNNFGMYKNRLQEYAQRAALPLPVYTTVSEGQPHDPKFRSTVLVDGRIYTSTNTFSVRKAAEQDAARIAFDYITTTMANAACPLVNEDTVLCKTIFHQLAAKLHLPQPTYDVFEREGEHPEFKCSVHFNGRTFTGEIRRNKKEAEQFAARAAILSLFGNPQYVTLLSEIIKSKSKRRSAGSSQDAPQGGVMSDGAGSSKRQSTNKKNKTKKMRINRPNNQWGPV